MIKLTIKHNKRYVDHPRYQSKLTCIIHSPGNSSDECKVLNCSGSKYTKIRPSKEHRKKPTPKKSFGNNQDKNPMCQNAVDEIILK